MGWESMMDLARLALWMTEGIGHRRLRRLVERFGDASAVLSAPASQLREVLPAAPAGRLAGLSCECLLAAARQEIERADGLGVRVLWREGAGYPSSLHDLTDPPEFVYLMGSLPPSGVGIVGARAADSYSLGVTHGLAGSLARAGMATISGGAVGVDTIAHRGSMEEGGRTIVVLPGGLDHPYPRRNVPLFHQVLSSGGGLLSEAPLGQPPLRRSFPRRNRLIAALSSDVVVIEAREDGGSMYTIQALWTAARYNIGAKFVVCNNESYKLLKLNVQQYWRERDIEEHEFPASFDLSEPPLRFAEIAQSLSVPGLRVEKPEEIAPALDKALSTDGPFLIDLVITNDVPGHKVGCKCGQ